MDTRGREFEWDPRKAESNIWKHGISFRVAMFAFDDVDKLNFPDDSDAGYGERRWICVGFVGPRLLTVVYTVIIEIPEKIRIVSARKATSHERRQYGEG